MVDKNENFEKIRKIFFEESSKNSVFRLSPEDIENVKNTIKVVAKLGRFVKKADPKSKETKNLKKNINKIKKTILSLFLARVNKIINNISTYIRSTDTKHFFETERVLLRCFRTILNTYKKHIKEAVDNLQYPDHRELEIQIIKNLFKTFRLDISDIMGNSKSSNMTILLFERDLPKLASPSGKIYGPFTKGDIVILKKQGNEQFIQNLVARGFAKQLK